MINRRGASWPVPRLRWRRRKARPVIRRYSYLSQTHRTAPSMVVGREAEQAAILETLASAAQRRPGPRIVLVGGPVSVGRSSLVDWAADLEHTQLSTGRLSVLNTNAFLYPEPRPAAGSGEWSQTRAIEKFIVSLLVAHFGGWWSRSLNLRFHVRDFLTSVEDPVAVARTTRRWSPRGRASRRAARLAQRSASEVLAHVSRRQARRRRLLVVIVDGASPDDAVLSVLSAGVRRADELRAPMVVIAASDHPSDHLVAEDDRELLLELPLEDLEDGDLAELLTRAAANAEVDWGPGALEHAVRVSRRHPRIAHLLGLRAIHQAIETGEAIGVADVDEALDAAIWDMEIDYEQVLRRLGVDILAAAQPQLPAVGQTLLAVDRLQARARRHWCSVDDVAQEVAWAPGDVEPHLEELCEQGLIERCGQQLRCRFPYIATAVDDGRLWDTSHLRGLEEQQRRPPPLV